MVYHNAFAIQKKKLLEMKCPFSQRETLNIDKAVTDNEYLYRWQQKSLKRAQILCIGSVPALCV